MGEGGYRRSPDQCKCKWKNVVSRYKGQETSDPENGRQCPFFEELHAVFTERTRNMQNMQRLLLESETGAPSPSKKKLKKSSGDRSSDEFSDDDDWDNEDSIGEQHSTRTRTNTDKVQQQVADKSKAAKNSVNELLQDIFQQQRSEAQWQEVMERKAMVRRRVEQEWLQSMEKLERERLMLEQAWQEREGQRRMREENRAAKRVALLTALLNKLIQGDL